MLELLAQIAADASVSDPYVGQGEAPALRERLATLTGKRKQRWKTSMELGFHELRLGNNEAAVAALTEAAELGAKLGDKAERADVERVQFDLALAWLRVAETRNCVARHTAQSCIVPIEAGGVHTDQEGARKAIEVLTATLSSNPDQIAAVWLLNLAAMTVGEYPDGVPKSFRIPPERFASDEPFPRFTDVAGALGLDTFSLSGGTIVDDFDGDGLYEIVNSTWNPAGQLRIFKGRADGTWVERTEEAGLTGLTGGLNLVHADYDNDGDPDVLVLRGAWLREAGRIPNSLLMNRGDGTFVDVTFEAGLGDVHYPTQTAAFADFDGDGDLDLYIGNEGGPRVDMPCQLFRNDGDGTFTDVARNAGVRNDRYAKGVTWGDYDGDRRPDLYVSNSNGPNRLYRNLGDGTFTDVAAEVGVQRPIASFPTWFWDYDNDGALDLYVASYLPTLDHVAASIAGLPTNAERGCLYRGDGKGGFEDVTAKAGLDEVTVVMGSNFGDLDGDGYLDFYLGTGYPGYEALMPNKMYRNRAGEGFADVTTAGGFGHVQKGHGVAFADLDRDGDQDVFIEMGGAFPGDAFRNAYFQNPGFGTHWITVRLTGVASNRSAIGARIRCEVLEGERRRSIYKYVNGGGSFGRNPLRQMIGLGGAERVEVLEVFWPTTGATQVFEDLAADQAIHVVEGEDEYAPE